MGAGFAYRNLGILRYSRRHVNDVIGDFRPRPASAKPITAKLLRCDWLGRIGLLLTRAVRHLAAHPFGSDRWLHRPRWVGWLVRYLDIYLFYVYGVDSFVPLEHIVPTLPAAPGGTGIVPAQLPTTTGSSATAAVVCLSNLPADVDDAVLCQLVRPFGAVQAARVETGSSGMRCATVATSSGDEALRLAAAFNGRVLGNCVVQAAAASAPPHYADAPVHTPPNPLVTLQPVLGLVPGCPQTLLLRDTAAAAAAAGVGGEVMMRQCLPQPYPAQTYELVQLPIM